MAEKNTKGAISIRNVTKIYDPEGVNVMAVDDCSLEIKSGEVCMIVGPSGCGKTTLLNAIAGFHSITEGEIYLDNEILCGPNKPLADQGSDRIVVFQHGALFPWKTLQENVAYGPIVQKVLPKNEALDKAGSLLEEAGIGDMMKKYPGEVSSGMARRAEIVRALINNPKVLLLDEPYRAMDALTKSIMHESLLEVYDKTNVTIFFITPFSTLNNSTKSPSLVSVKSFLCKTVDNLNRSAPGAVSFENPLALSYRSVLTEEGPIVSSFSKKPTL